MAAYVIYEIEVNDAAAYEEYKKLAPASIAAYGGKYLARAGKTETLEGGWLPKRLVILEFPTFEQATKWHDSPEYSPAREMREKAAKSRAVVIQGT